MWRVSLAGARSAGSASRARSCQAASATRTPSGRSRATKRRARGLLSRSLAIAGHVTASGGTEDTRAVSRVPTVSADFPPVEGVEHRYVDAGGLRVHVAEAGPADAPPILLLHGWPQ